MSLLILDLFSTRINNRSLSAEPDVSGLKPGEASLHPCAALSELLFNTSWFQVTAVGPMPLGLVFAQPNHLVSA